MYRKMGAVIEFADKTPKQMRFSVTPPFALDYVLAPFGKCLFHDAASGWVKANLAGIAHKRNF
jgi:hypothetical protein